MAKNLYLLLLNYLFCLVITSCRKEQAQLQLNAADSVAGTYYTHINKSDSSNGQTVNTSSYQNETITALVNDSIEFSGFKISSSFNFVPDRLAFQVLSSNKNQRVFQYYIGDVSVLINTTLTYFPANDSIFATYHLAGYGGQNDISYSGKRVK